jgi:hypothetical protein
MTLSSTAEPVFGRFQELTPGECLGLLRSKRLGRVAYDDAGPVVLPVHYVIDNDTVLFRTSPYSSLGQNMRTSQAALEVDEIDDETHAGWSVLVRGPARYVEATDLPDTAARPTPWRECKEAQSLHVRITPTTISGRRLDRGPAADQSGELT